MERVRLGVLGAGNIAVMNVRGYLEDPRCDVVAVCDSDEEVGRQAAKEWGAESFHSNLSDMLADDSIDAVEVLTPTHLHHDHVIAALEAGKHVSVQKPVANSVEDALEMQAVAERVGRILRISECFVHYPPLELAKRLVADGAIGKPTSLRIRTLVGQTDSAFQAALRPEGYGWRLDKRSPGGHLFDDMVHKYAMALWLLDLDITSVQAVVRRRDLFFEPCAVIFEYEDPDVLGMMEVQYSPNFYMRSSYYGADEFFEITGDEGQIWVTRATGEMLDLAPVMLFTGTPHERKTTEFTDLDADWGAGFVRSSQHFVDALLQGSPAAMTAAEATDVLRLCFAVYAAGQTRSPVDPRTRHRDREPPGLGGVVAQADPLTPREAARRRLRRVVVGDDRAAHGLPSHTSRVIHDDDPGGIPMTTSADDVEVVDVPAESRFVVRRNGTVAELVYARAGRPAGARPHRGPRRDERAGHRRSPGSGGRPPRPIGSSDDRAVVPVRPSVAAGAPGRRGRPDHRLGYAAPARGVTAPGHRIVTH